VLHRDIYHDIIDYKYRNSVDFMTYALSYFMLDSGLIVSNLLVYSCIYVTVC